MTPKHPSMREAEAMQVECPVCQAPVGSWCYFTGTARMNNYIHVKRLPKRT